jgi:mono/diheme cytochrome c family protein
MTLHRSALLIVSLSMAAMAQAHAEMPMQTLYTLNCSGCHGNEGLGVPEVGIPNLNDAGRYVGTALGRQYLIKVPGLSQSRLDNATAAKLLNWILQKFSSDRVPADFKPYTTEEVAEFRSQIASDAETQRAAILAELRSRGQLEPGYDPAPARQ